MRKWASMVAVAAGLVATGCISGFRHPLGPPEEGFVESQLTGTWSCVSADEPALSRLTIVDFDGKQYYLESEEEGGKDRGRLRGHATRLEGATFLSVRELDGDPDGTWTILQYDLPEAGRLTLRMVAAEPFEDVIDDPDRVRERLASHLDTRESDAVLECRRRNDARESRGAR